MSEYFPPKYKEEQFHCVHCGVFAHQRWGNLLFSGGGQSDLRYSGCFHCKEICYWYKDRMILPLEAPVPRGHIDLPSACVEDYEEARDIVSRSPRAAAALLRLTLQKLMIELGESGENLNNDIASLVRKGLPVEVQQALDYCRVVGNNAVHPGELIIDDKPEIAHGLFEMVNFIVESRISQPKKIADLYKVLPEGALEAVRKRDEAKD